MKTMYFITMVEGTKQSYVATTNDIEVGGFVDASPEDFGFATREEAEDTMAELQAYASEKGYNVSFFIEEVKTETVVDNVECTRDGHQGITLSFDLDGVHNTVTGEFFIDKDGILHHTAIDSEGNEIEITCKYF